VSLSELFFLGLLGLVFFEPMKLTAVGQRAGQMPARLKKVSSDF
jgi:Sec-independent protein translocase protein TatA